MMEFHSNSVIHRPPEPAPPSSLLRRIGWRWQRLARRRTPLGPLGDVIILAGVWLAIIIAAAFWPWRGGV